MKKQQRCRWLDESVDVRAVWACAFLVLTASLLLSCSRADRSTPAAINATLVASNNPSSPKPIKLPWYIRSGQWHADVRSLAALLRYLTDCEQVTRTNPIPPKADNA